MKKIGVLGVGIKRQVVSYIYGGMTCLFHISFILPIFPLKISLHSTLRGFGLPVVPFPPRQSFLQFILQTKGGGNAAHVVYHAAEVK